MRASLGSIVLGAQGHGRACQTAAVTVVEDRGEGAVAGMQAREGAEELRIEALVERHADVVWRFAVGILGDAADADEVAQDTFVRADGALDGFRGDAAPRTWLLAICRNLCIDRLRSRRPTVSLDELHEGGFDPGGEDRIDDRVGLRALLRDGVDELPEDEREAFVLVDVLGFSGEEAAVVCEVPATTLRSRRHRAHHRLVEHVTAGDR